MKLGDEIQIQISDEVTASLYNTKIDHCFIEARISCTGIVVGFFGDRSVDFFIVLSDSKRMIVSETEVIASKKDDEKCIVPLCNNTVGQIQYTPVKVCASCQRAFTAGYEIGKQSIHG